MGSIHASDLINGKRPEFPPPLSNPWSDFPVGIQHFPAEAFLSDREWIADHPGRGFDPDKPLGRDERRKFRNDHSHFMMRRWYETDFRAPHPNLDEVRKAMEELDREKKAPKP